VLAVGRPRSGRQLDLPAPRLFATPVAPEVWADVASAACDRANLVGIVALKRVETQVADYVAAGVAAAGAAMALVLLPAQPTASRDDAPEAPAPATRSGQAGTPATARPFSR
jgi:hypothetical protein